MFKVYFVLVHCAQIDLLAIPPSSILLEHPLIQINLSFFAHTPLDEHPPPPQELTKF